MRHMNLEQSLEGYSKVAAKKFLEEDIKKNTGHGLKYIDTISVDMKSITICVKDQARPELIDYKWINENSHNFEYINYSLSCLMTNRIIVYKEGNVYVIYDGHHKHYIKVKN